MKKRLLGMVLIFVFIVLPFGGCLKDNGKGKSFAYPIDKIPSSIDPQVVSGTDEKIIVNNCFEGLIRLGENGEIICGAAENYTVSENGTVYIFNIRDDAKWHVTSKFKDILGEDYKSTFDNRLTANDFVFAFRRALSAQTGTPTVKLLYAIKNAEDVYNGNKSASSLGVTAIDGKTLKIELSHPFVEFLSVLAQPMCMPCNETFFNATSGRYGRGAEYTLCNGPFYFSRIVEDASVSLLKNEDYVGESEVFPSAVNFKISDGKTTVVDRILSGSLSAAQVSSDESKSLASSKGITITNCENTLWAFCLNTNNDALKNVHLRSALFSCIDSSVFSSASFNSSPASGLVLPVCLAGETNYRLLASDVAVTKSSDASDLWQKALKELDIDTIDLTISCATEHEVEVRTLLQQWQKSFGLSCAIKVNPVQRAELEKAVQNKNYEIAFAPITASQSSALSFLDLFSQTSPLNVVAYSSPEYSSVISKASLAGNTEALVKSCMEAEQIILNEHVIYPVFYEARGLIMGEDVSGVRFSPAGETADFILAKR